MAPIDQHSHQSVYRERLLEHLLTGELLKHSWLHHQASLEVSLPAIDRSGYDIVLEAGGITRHVQLKSSLLGGKTRSQKVHVALASKPSGCVIWMRFDPATLALGPFLFYGGPPGKPLPDPQGLRIARHSKGDATGMKAERPNLRLVPQSLFRSVPSIPELYEVLFGA